MFGFFNKSKSEYNRYKKIVEEIKDLSKDYDSLENEELINKYKNTEDKKELLAIAKIASKRSIGLDPHDVQLIGALVLSEAKIAEMKTGEGKTLVAALAGLLKAKEGNVHIVTVNDYLSTRDSEQMRPLFEMMGYSVGNINGQNVNIREEYAKDIVYGIHQSFVNNYLRNNMLYKEQVLLPIKYDYCIVDEIDSILIDEARTPITISGQKETNVDLYEQAQKIALELEDSDYKIEQYSVRLTDKGIQTVEEKFGIDNLYTAVEAEKAHHMEQALKANYLMIKDKDYIVKDGDIMVIDGLSGRLQPGRRFSEGLHQALETKEGLPVQMESQPYARITYQNYFRLYNNLSGMTGTAKTEEEEFRVIYKLDVVSIETNKPVKRVDHLDMVYLNKEVKNKAVLNKVKEVHKKGQPLLIGTASVDSSEEISELLKEEGIVHEVLNAKNHEREAEIIAKAGNLNSVTVATNMAGRGVDIKISKEVEELGGLFVLGVERYENRRIDDQLRGRSGRQGDNGESQFFVSFEDDLMKKSGGDRIKLMMEKYGGMSKNDNLNNKSISKTIENIQKKLEGHNFDARKHILEYDDIMNEHRIVFYKFREEILKDVVSIEEKTDEYCLDYKEYLKELNDSDKEIKELGIESIDTLEIEYKKKRDILKERSEDLEKQFALAYLDSLWADHLYKMDLLKRGIGLRQYNQKDPLSEYKKESFLLLESFITGFKRKLIKEILIYELPEEKKEELEEKIEELEEKVHELEENTENTVLEEELEIENTYQKVVKSINFSEKKEKRKEKRLKKLKNYLK